MTSLPSQTMVPTDTTFGRLMTGAGLVREVLVTLPLWPKSGLSFLSGGVVSTLYG